MNLLQATLLTGAMVALAAPAGCIDPGHGCGASFEQPIYVAVFDADTQAPASVGATATLTRNSVVYPLELVGEGDWVTFVWANEEQPREGFYHLQVEKEGYQTWTKSNVRLDHGPCGWLSAHERVDLVPLASPLGNVQEVAD